MKVLVLYDYQKNPRLMPRSDGKVIEVRSHTLIKEAFFKIIAREKYFHCEITSYLTESGNPWFNEELH